MTTVKHTLVLCHPCLSPLAIIHMQLNVNIQLNKYSNIPSLICRGTQCAEHCELEYCVTSREDSGVV